MSELHLTANPLESIREWHVPGLGRPENAVSVQPGAGGQGSEAKSQRGHLR